MTKTKKSKIINQQYAEVALDVLKPHPMNPRRGDVAQISKSIAHNGFYGALVVQKSTNHILAGNHRYLAAKDQGMASLPVIWVEVDEAEAQRILLADNRTSDLGDYNNEQLAALLDGLAQGDGLEGTGYEQGDLDKLLAGLAPVEGVLKEDPALEDVDEDVTPNKAEELRAKWNVQPGQIWQLGRHKIYCGDSTCAKDVERLMGDESADLCFTSPPYADQRTYKESNDLSVGSISKFISASADFVDLYAVNLGLKREGGAVVCYWDVYIKEALDCGLLLLSWNVWSRHGYGGSIGNMTAMFPIEHEWVFVFGERSRDINRTVKNKSFGESFSATARRADGETTRLKGGSVAEYGRMGSVFVSDVQRGQKDHPAAFPVALPRGYIEACTPIGAVVYEPFGGSGTTILACEQTGRECRAIEISPSYVAIAIQRWVDMTGGEPELINE